MGSPPRVEALCRRHHKNQNPWSLQARAKLKHRTPKRNPRTLIDKLKNGEPLYKRPLPPFIAWGRYVTSRLNIPLFRGDICLDTQSGDGRSTFNPPYFHTPPLPYTCACGPLYTSHWLHSLTLICVFCTLHLSCLFLCTFYYVHVHMVHGFLAVARNLHDIGSFMQTMEESWHWFGHDLVSRESQ